MNEPVLDRLAGGPGVSLGKQLTKARKARGWTPGYVASQLHLPESTIDSLELEDYARLPAEVYVKGYLRNYSRLLRLPPDDIVQAYMEQRGTATSVGRAAASLEKSDVLGERRSAAPIHLRKTPPRLEREQQAGTPRYGALLWVGAALVLGYVATWWWPDSKESGMFDRLAEFRSGVTSSTAVNESGVGTVEREHVVPDFDTTDASPQPSMPGEAATAAGAPEGSARSAAADTPPGSAGGETGLDTLSLRFDGESWATVVDADGKRLLHQTGAKGTSKTLSGKAPFNLTIGRIADVAIEFNGQAFEFPDAKKRATERFSIPLSSKDQQRLGRN